MRTFYLILFILVRVFCANSQTTEALQINYLGQEQGLLQLNTKVLALDDMGYLWVGTEDGLHRFNGYKFKGYIANPKDSTAIPDDHIRGLLAINDTLWIATNTKGIIGYKRSENTFFSLLKTAEDPEIFNTYHAFKLNTKQLLFSVKNHFVLFNRKDKTYKLFKLPSKGIENGVNAVLMKNENTVWLATKASGILTFNLNTEAIKPLADFKNNNASSFIACRDKIFIGTAQGLYIYNKITKVFELTAVTAEVHGLHKINDFEFFVILKKGMIKYNSKKDSFSSLVFNDVKEGKYYTSVDFTQVLEDTNGNIWFGTQGEGVFHYNKFQNKFESHKIDLPDLEGDQHISVFPIQRGTGADLWLGTYVGIVKFNLETNAYKRYNTAKGSVIYEFCMDSQGTLWAGSISDGLLKYDKGQDRFKQWTHSDTDSINSLSDNEVLNIIPKSKDKLWVCTWAGGINEFDIEKETFSPVLFDGKKIDRARTAIIDSKKQIWLGTDHGLYKVSDNKILAHYTEDETSSIPLSNTRIFAIAEDAVGNLWLGTSSGLTYLNLKSQTSELYYKQKGFPNDFIYGLIVDNNKLWMSTNYGLSVFDTDKRTFKNYSKEDGLQDNEFNGKSFFKDDSGLLYFGGINGFNIIDPNKVVDNPFMPDVHLESVQLFNKPIEQNEMFKDTLVFKSKENVLTFNFSAINYLNPKKGLYRYKLDNFDADWSPVTKKKSVTYTNLNPGNYTLKIMASNDVGQWNPKFKEVYLTIVPPWYLSAWFKVLLFGLLLLSGIIFYKFKTTRLKQDKFKLAALVDVKTKDLIEKNEELNTSNAVMVEQKNNIEFLMKELSHRVKNNLQIISSLLNMQAQNVESQEVKDILNLAKNRILTIAYIQNDLMVKEGVVDVSDFLKDFTQKILSLLADQDAQKFKVEYDLESHCTCEINITILGLILNELITNTYKYAFKVYSPDHVLKISCVRSQAVLHISITDNGIGYNQDQVRDNALGLDLVKTMVQQLNGTIKVSSHTGVKNEIEIPC